MAAAASRCERVLRLSCLHPGPEHTRRVLFETDFYEPIQSESEYYSLQRVLVEIPSFGFRANTHTLAHCMKESVRIL